MGAITYVAFFIVFGAVGIYTAPMLLGQLEPTASWPADALSLAALALAAAAAHTLAREFARAR